MQETSLLQDDLKYFLSLTSDEALQTFTIKDRERFSAEEAIRLGQAVGLCLTRTIALALKARWQSSLVSATTQASSPVSLVEFMGCRPDETGPYPQDKWDRAGSVQSMDELYTSFAESGLLSLPRRMEREEFLELAGIVLDRRLHLVPANSPELLEFAYGREGNKSLLPGESGAESERYWITHSTWKELEEELATLLLRLETQSLRNEQVNQRWLETFGHLYVPLMELEAIYSAISAMIEHVRTNPELSLEEREKLERELQVIRSESGRERKREPSKKGSDDGGAGPGGIPWSASEQSAYEEECKSVLRRIWQLTHPDRIGREGFTEVQKECLLESYQEAMAWKEKSQLDEYEIGLARRSTAALRIILDRVERIWEEMGLDGDSVARVRGKSPEERMAWLEARISILDEEIKEIKADILAVSGDRDIREKEACLVSPERIQAVSAHMEERFEWYRQEISVKEDELARLLAAGKEGGDHV
jgi:hypothetical protein